MCETNRRLIGLTCKISQVKHIWYMGVYKFIREHLIKMDDLGVPPFVETLKWTGRLWSSESGNQHSTGDISKGDSCRCIFDHICLSVLERFFMRLSARCLRGNKNCYAAGTFVELFNCLLDPFADWKKAPRDQLVSWHSIPSSLSQAAYSKRGGRDRCFAAQLDLKTHIWYNVDASL